MATKPLSRSYVKAFLEYNGTGPWECDDKECEYMVTQITGRTRWDGVVHHRDEDYANESRENLGVFHRSCHMRHHFKGKRKLDPKICPTCNKEFAPRHKNTVYCSMDCKIEKCRGAHILGDRQPLSKIVCRCGNIFKPRRSTSKYCSNSCKFDAARERR